ncbi:MAG TPA: hypothetical protein VLL97_03815, partial [Acidobacteriota bacterium]|nr:hypothetical protein [Acidobacteriota bacterium]
TFHARFPFMNQDSMSASIGWAGSRRLGTVLIPRISGAPSIKVDSYGKNSFRVGATDWISIGSLNERVTIGTFTHVSQYSVVRERAGRFPALLMVSGLECMFETHSLSSTKPLTASLNGLHGEFMSSRPDTVVELRSPEIRQGDRFLVNDRLFVPVEKGILVLTLEQPGRHTFSRNLSVDVPR